MQEQPLISIITVNLNNLDGLVKTMASVLEQTYTNFEYIIIDGGSIDGSKEFIDSKSHELDHCVSEEDSGIYNAMNKGIQKANGEYLLFLNSGDLLVNNFVLEENFKLLKSYDLIYFDLKVCNGSNYYKKSYPEDLSFSYFIHDSLPHPATFIKASLFKKIDFYDEKLKIVADWKFFLECVCKYNVSYLKINKTLASFNLNGLSSSEAGKEIIREEKMLVLRSNFNAYLKDSDRLSKLETLLSELRNSKKLKLLVKFGFLNKF